MSFVGKVKCRIFNNREIIYRCIKRASERTEQTQVDVLAIVLTLFLFFLGHQLRFFLHYFHQDSCLKKHPSGLSDKIHVDRIMAVEARTISPSKILVLLKFLSDSFSLEILL